MSGDHADSSTEKPVASHENALWNQLENAVTMAAKQDQIVWTVFGVFCAAEAVLLAALFQSGGPPTGYVGRVVSYAGIVISVVWWLIQIRALAWLRFYEDVVIELEKNNLSIPVNVRVTVPKEDLKEKVKWEFLGLRVSVRIRWLMSVCPLISVLAWVVGLWLFLSNALVDASAGYNLNLILNQNKIQYAVPPGKDVKMILDKDGKLDFQTTNSVK
jgi:hypothetical protein